MSKCDGINVGDRVSMKMVATDEIVVRLAEVSGDKNPVHLDSEYAATTVFGKRIAHGLFCLGMVSNLLGTKLPGKGTVLVNESVNYRLLVYINDEIETTVKVLQIIPEKNKLSMEITCINQNGKTVLDGIAMVKIM